MYVVYVIPQYHVFIVYTNPITTFILYIITFYSMFYAFDAIMFYCTWSEMTRIKIINQSINQVICRQINVLPDLIESKYCLERYGKEVAVIKICYTYRIVSFYEFVTKPISALFLFYAIIYIVKNAENVSFNLNGESLGCNALNSRWDFPSYAIGHWQHPCTVVTADNWMWKVSLWTKPVKCV